MHRTNPGLGVTAMFLIGCGGEPSDSGQPGSGGARGRDPRYAEMAARAAEAPRETTVQAVAETEPMPFAEGGAVWVHPSDRSRSTVIVSDQALGLRVFGLDGQRRQELSLGVLGAAGVDVRYDVPLGVERVSLVVAANTGENFIRAFVADPESGMLESVVSQDLPTGNTAHGSCLYRSPVSSKLYFFATSKDGLIVQHELSDDGNGMITADKVRELQVSGGNPAVEACVADDTLGLLYLAQEEEARILRYAAEPDGGDEATLIDDVGDEALLNTEGLGIYGVAETGGYLVVALQGTWKYRVYTRDPGAHGGAHVYLGSFEVVDGSVDAATSADAMAATNANLGGPFAAGMLLVQDRFDIPKVAEGETNYKLVPWQSVADGLDLLVDPR